MTRFVTVFLSDSKYAIKRIINFNNNQGRKEKTFKTFLKFSFKVYLSMFFFKFFMTWVYECALFFFLHKHLSIVQGFQSSPTKITTGRHPKKNLFSLAQVKKNTEKTMCHHKQRNMYLFLYYRLFTKTTLARSFLGMARPIDSHYAHYIAFYTSLVKMKAKAPINLSCSTCK